MQHMSSKRSNYWAARLGFAQQPEGAPPNVLAPPANFPTGTAGTGGGYYINQSLPLDSYYEQKMKQPPNGSTSTIPSSISDQGGALTATNYAPKKSAPKLSFEQTHQGFSAARATDHHHNDEPLVRTGTLGPGMKMFGGTTVDVGPSSSKPSQLTTTNLSTYFSSKQNTAGGLGFDFGAPPSSPVSTCSCQSDPDAEAVMSSIIGVGSHEVASATNDPIDIEKILEADFGETFKRRSRMASLSLSGTKSRPPVVRRHRTYHRSNCPWHKANFRAHGTGPKFCEGGVPEESELEELRRRSNLVLKRHGLKENLIKKRNQKMVARDVDHIDRVMCSRKEEEETEKLRVREERRAKRLAFKREVRDQRERKAEETEIEAYFLKRFVGALQHESEEAERHLERAGAHASIGSSSAHIVSDSNITTGFSFAIAADDVDLGTQLRDVPAEDHKTMCGGLLSPKEYDRIMGATNLLLAYSTQDGLQTKPAEQRASVSTADSSMSGEGLEMASSEDEENDFRSESSDEYNFDLEACTEKMRGVASLLVHKYIQHFDICVDQHHRDEYKAVRRELTAAHDALNQQEARLGKINNVLRRNVEEYEDRLRREEEARMAVEREEQHAIKQFERGLKAQRHGFWNNKVMGAFQALAEEECAALNDLLEEAKGSYQASLSRCRGRIFNECLAETQRTELEEGVHDAITRTRNAWITERFPLLQISAEKCVELAHLMLEEAYQAEVAEDHQIRHLQWEMQQQQGGGVPAVNSLASLTMAMTPPSSPRAAKVFFSEAGSSAAHAAASDVLMRLSSDREVFSTLLMLGVVDNKGQGLNLEVLFGCLLKGVGVATAPPHLDSSNLFESDERTLAAKRKQARLQQQLAQVTYNSMLSQLVEVAADLLLSDEEADELDAILESAGEKQRLQVLDDFAAMDVLRKRLKKRRS